MIPKSLSASAIQVAESCLSRYYAENIIKAERPPNRAASLGTVVHAALEWYVKAVYIDKTKPESLDALLALFKMHFAVEFETFDTDSEEYKDGVDMLQRWYGRTTGILREREVISCETKTNFAVPTSIGEIPFNYIWDRFDKLPGDEEYEVVDYKSIRFSFGPEELKNKIQARCYSLAARIQRPAAKRIWVRFDLLRHDSVAVVFNRDQDIATWNYLLATAERIIATPETDIAETLNAECKWCVRKLACVSLQSHIGGGGILGAGEELYDRRADVGYRLQALQQLAREMDEVILREAERTDSVEFITDSNRLSIGWSQRRTVDPERVLMVTGQALFDKYDGPLMTYTSFNRLLKDRGVTPEMKEKLKLLVYTRRGEPTVKVSPKNPIDGD